MKNLQEVIQESLGLKVNPKKNTFDITGLTGDEYTLIQQALKNSNDKKCQDLLDRILDCEE